MLPGLAPSVPARIPPTLAYVGGLSSGSDTTSYSFGSLSLGSKDANGKRWTVACAGAYDESAARTITSITIGGQPATIVALPSTPGRAAVAIAIVDTSSLADTVTGAFTVDATTNAGALTLYRMYDIIDPTPFSTNDGLETGGLINLSTNIAVPGCTVAVVMTRNPSLASYTWSGLTENADLDIDSNDYFSVASGGVVGSPTSISVQCADTSPDSMRACVASWR